MSNDWKTPIAEKINRNDWGKSKLFLWIFPFHFEMTVTKS